MIGSLRNPKIPDIANQLRAAGFHTFDDWFAAGPEADDKWKAYEQSRGRSYADALQGEAARNVFAFDKRHIEAAHTVVLVMPAGKSGFLELGWALGKGKRGYILLESGTDRWDVMFQFADGVAATLPDLLDMLRVGRMQKEMRPIPKADFMKRTEHLTAGQTFNEHSAHCPKCNTVMSLKEADTHQC